MPEPAWWTHEHLTVIELTAVESRTTVLMAVEPLHDQVWTERLLAGRANELDNLGSVIATRHAE